MTKTVSLNDYTYSELAVLAGRLSMIAKKPISLGMAIAMATAMFEAYLNLPGAEGRLGKKFSKLGARMLTREEFDVHWDKFFKLITEEKKE